MFLFFSKSFADDLSAVFSCFSGGVNDPKNGEPEPCNTKKNRKKCGQEWVDKYQDKWMHRAQYDCCTNPDVPTREEEAELLEQEGGGDKAAGGGGDASLDSDLDQFLDEL